MTAPVAPCCSSPGCEAWAPYSYGSPIWRRRVRVCAEHRGVIEDAIAKESAPWEEEPADVSVPAPAKPVQEALL